MRDVAFFQSKLDRLKGRKEQIRLSKKSVENTLQEIESEQKDLEEAQAIVQTVAQATQTELEYHVSELVSLALEAVFPEPYKMALDFELRRGKTEADITLVDPNDPETRIDPMTSTGGGVVDVASFGLRVTCWSLKTERTRPTLVLDEPFRFLSSDLQQKASVMLKELSHRLGIQFIIVTHEKELIEGKVDRLFEIRQNPKLILSVDSDEEERFRVSYLAGKVSKTRRTK